MLSFFPWRHLPLLLAASLGLILFATCTSPAPMQVPDVMDLPKEPAEARVFYGPDSLQFGDLRVPGGTGPHPVVVIIHGGCWLAAYDLTLMDAMATELTEQGYATWNLEYRRVGNPGGGWPNTFTDVAQGVNYLRELAREYPLDLDRVVVTGHSAGGHLALWLAGIPQLPPGSPISVANPLPLSGIVSLAGITDPEAYLVRNGGGCGASVDELMGGLPEDVPDHYQQGSPFALAPLGVPQILINGAADNIVPLSHVGPYYEKARAGGDPVELVIVEGAGHFEVIAPGSIAWDEVEEAIRELLDYQ